MKFLTELVERCLGLCLHVRRPLLKRGPEDRMGFECPDCFQWWPVGIERSQVADRMDLLQQIERWERQAKPGFKPAESGELCKRTRNTWSIESTHRLPSRMN